MKKLMTLVLALVLVFTVASVGFADSGTYIEGEFGGGINSAGVITVPATTGLTEITSIVITWTNDWAVAYTWQDTPATTVPQAWVAVVDTDLVANVIDFTADNNSTRNKTVKAVFADSMLTDATPGNYGLAVSADGDLAGESGKLLSYEGATGDIAHCTLTLAAKDAGSGVNVAGQAAYASIPEGLSTIDLGKMTFTVS